MPEYLSDVSEIIKIIKTNKKTYIFNLLYLLSYFPEKNKKQQIKAIRGMYVGFKKRFDNSCLTSSKVSLVPQFCEILFNLSKTQLYKVFESVS